MLVKDGAAVLLGYACVRHTTQEIVQRVGHGLGPGCRLLLLKRHLVLLEHHLLFPLLLFLLLPAGHEQIACRHGNHLLRLTTFQDMDCPQAIVFTGYLEKISNTIPTTLMLKLCCFLSNGMVKTMNY